MRTINTKIRSGLSLFWVLTEKYASIDEEDLDISGIYEMRERKLLIAGPNPVG
jgi:hypothetical protein